MLEILQKHGLLLFSISIIIKTICIKWVSSSDTLKIIKHV